MPPHTYVIAEAGVNHNGDLQIAKDLIHVAAEAGADAVKFQSFKAERLASPSAPKAPYQTSARGFGSTQMDMLKQLELDPDAQKTLADECARKGVVFLSSPFDFESVDDLERLGVPLFKIPSGELTHYPFLRHVARKNKPLILSTGMATLEEVEGALAVIRAESEAEVTLLHCVTAYPTPTDQVNLRAMITMREAFGAPVGFSDHTLGIEVSLAAVAMGACVIEKHFTMSRELDGPDHRASLVPEELKDLVRGIRTIELALGDGEKKPAPCEASNIPVVRRSLFAAGDIPAGTLLRPEMVQCRRPGTGVPARDYDRVIGHRVTKAYKAGEMLGWEGIDESAGQDR